MTNLYVARSERLAARKLASETVILPDDSGLYVLNELGTIIWEAADGTTALATIVERAICPQFDIDAPTALHDATEFVGASPGPQHFESLRDADGRRPALVGIRREGLIMSTVLKHVIGRAEALKLPISVQFDLTYRCNERCVHCYLDHDDHGELTTREVKDVLDQLAAAGTLFLTFSGGELLLRTDFFELLEYACALQFDLKIKTNAILIKEADARRIRELGVRQVQVSIYSHRAEVHDAITKVAGSLDRSIAAIRFLQAQGLRVLIANVLMRQNVTDYPGVQALARVLGVEFTLDPTITPKMDGDTSLVALRIPTTQLLRVYTDKSLMGEAVIPPPAGAVDADALDDTPCSAGHGLLRLSVRGYLSVRAVSSADRQSAARAV